MKPDTAPNDFSNPTLSIEQAAKLLLCGTDAVKELISSGEVPALELNQKHTVLLRDDVIAYVSKRGREQAAERRELRERRQQPPAQTRTSSPIQTRRRTVLPDLTKYDITTAESRA